MSAEIFIIAPHPDDETIACGGTILDRIQRGYSVNVVLMTDGRNSHVVCFKITDDPTPDRLAEIRTDEFRRVVARLGVPQSNATCLGFYDASLQRNLRPATFALQSILKEKAQDIEEIYYPSVYDSHPDHNATHKAATAALDALDIRAKRCCYTVWPRKQTILPEPDLNIDISTYMAAKSSAMSLYVSQVERISPKQPAPVLKLDFLAKFFNTPQEHFWLA